MARVTEETLTGQIRSLNPGQSFSRTKRLAVDGSDDMTPTEALQKLRNLVNQAVGRIRKEDPGSTFRVESATGLTSGHEAILCTVAVTRFAEGDEDGDEVDI